MPKSGIMLNILPQARMPRNMLYQLIQLDVRNPSSYMLNNTIDEIATNLNSPELEAEREELIVDTNISEMRKLHKISVALLKPYITNASAMLESVPALLEAVSLRYITIPNLDPSYHVEYSISPTAHVNLVQLASFNKSTKPMSQQAPLLLTSFINNLSLPPTPILYKSKRVVQIKLTFPFTTVRKLYSLGNLILVPTSNTRMDAIALDWILNTYDTQTIMEAMPTTSIAEVVSV